MGSEKDYLQVLQALHDIPFGVGKKLLIQFLQGDTSHESIQRNRLDLLDSFGSLAYDDDEIEAIISNLITNKYITYDTIDGKRFWKVLVLTYTGREELKNPTLHTKKVSHSLVYSPTIITEQDKKVFAALDSFLGKYNDSQKKAIISNNTHILCIAGAGSGKTTVLTKKIEFLTTYYSIRPQDILAITFTRKARQEMQHRLSHIPQVSVETFNSFCEKLLNRYNNVVYSTHVSMLTYKDKIVIIRKALSALQMSMSYAISLYFTQAQQRGKTNEQLANIFMNDCFFIRDYLISKHKDFSEFESSDPAARLVFKVGAYIDAYMKKHGKRDFTDQLMDTLSLFKKRPYIIPQYKYILIDEFQDINDTQMKLVEELGAPHLFCVGDPRQSIFGWRGSSIQYILDFQKKYPQCEVVTLTHNYRSTKAIVELMNACISDMGFSDLEAVKEGVKKISLCSFSTEESEYWFICEQINKMTIAREEIFILARTNRQLTEVSEKLTAAGIMHVVKSDELRQNVHAKKGQVTLATIHAIKGLEAQVVFVIGCTINNFPCRGSEHPVVDLVTVDEYDKEEEEKRLFYVAISRAQSELILTYTGKKPTSFITPSMYKLICEQKVTVKQTSESAESRLREWRKSVSQSLGVAPFMILHDRTLIELASQKPSTLSELEHIYGMGGTKIKKYGEEILELLY